MIKLSGEYKEALSTIAGGKQYPILVNFLKTQKNNIAIFEWVRVKSSDPDIIRKKAYYEGQADWIDLFLEVLENAKKGQDDE